MHSNQPYQIGVHVINANVCIICCLNAVNRCCLKMPQAWLKDKCHVRINTSIYTHTQHKAVLTAVTSLYAVIRHQWEIPTWHNQWKQRPCPEDADQCYKSNISWTGFLVHWLWAQKRLCLLSLKENHAILYRRYCKLDL